MPPFWACGAAALDGSRKEGRANAAPSVADAIAAAVDALREQARSVPRLAVAFGSIVQQWRHSASTTCWCSACNGAMAAESSASRFW